MNREKILKTEGYFKKIFEILGLDLKSDGLKESPNRIAKTWINEIFKGLDDKNFPECKTFKNDFNLEEPVLYKNISVYSMCEHHFLPFFGHANIVYKPNKKILGLSKFNRIVDFYSRKPQLQERLTSEIFFKLKDILETEDLAISIKCIHMCVKMRGIQDENSLLITNSIGGLFKEKNKIPDNFLFKDE